MLYYGRKAVAEESMESFLRQTYPDKKLLIINSHPDRVWFKKDYPNVEIQNKKDSDFANLNDKYMYALRQIKTSWWCPWDSDDIWLPWHLENLMQAAIEVKKKVNPSIPIKMGTKQSYIMSRNGKNPKRIGVQRAMAGACVWETFDKDGNLYPYIDSTKTTFWDRQVLSQKWHLYGLKDKPMSFIFRWYNNDQYVDGDILHRSKIISQPGMVYEELLKNKMYSIEHKDPWYPHWDEDYVAKVRKAKNTETCTTFHRQINE